MNILHLATKNFDRGVSSTRSIVYDGLPLVIRRGGTAAQEVYNFSKPAEQNIVVTESVKAASDDLQESPIGKIVFKNGRILPLSQLYDFKVLKGDPLAEALPEGTTFCELLESDILDEYMTKMASDMYPNINPLTGQPDVTGKEYYAKYIPLVSLTGCVAVQTHDGQAFFNPEGVVTVADFLDGLNALSHGANSNKTRQKSIDNISDTEDYFNEGYQSCIRSMSSPFFNLYTREELMKPITRIELAYITVLCWTRFVDKYNNLYGNAYDLGVNVDWYSPGTVLEHYTDGFDYKVSCIRLDKEHGIISLNIKDYKSDRSMTEYKADLRNGKTPIPLPMLMSLVELGAIGVWHFDKALNPLSEVTRGELCYFYAKLANLFPTKYIK